MLLGNHEWAWKWHLSGQRSSPTEGELPVPFLLFCHHHFPSNENVLLVIHNFRQSKLDVWWMDDMNWEMPRSDADRLSNQLFPWGQACLLRLVQGRYCIACRPLPQQDWLRGPKLAKPELRLFSWEIRNSCGKTRCKLYSLDGWDQDLPNSSQALWVDLFLPEANQKFPKFRRISDEEMTTYGNLADGSGMPWYLLNSANLRSARSLRLICFSVSSRSGLDHPRVLLGEVSASAIIVSAKDLKSW